MTTTTPTPALADLDLNKLQAIADRVDARGLFNASCDIREWIASARTALARRAAQPVAPAQDVLTIPAAIMDIACDHRLHDEYKRGHRDARHAAADLVLARADELKALAAQPAEGAGQAGQVAMTADELAALRRFYECAADGEGYDVPKPMMRRLSEIGVVQRISGAYYHTTEYGLAVLDSTELASAPANQPSAQVKP